MKWTSTLIVVSVVAALAAMTLLGKLNGTEVVPMMSAVLTYAIGFHAVTVSNNGNGNGNGKDSHDA